MYMEEEDLDINNYKLDDILQLFKMPMDFNEADMKRAKQIVLKTHPDKSRLSPKYFLFYSKAYKVIFSMYQFKNKNSKTRERESTYENLSESTKFETEKRLLDNFFSHNSKLKEDNTHFNQWFNQEFERNKMSRDDEDKGYGNWLTSNEDVDEEKRITMATMKEEFDKKKTQVRSLVVHQDISDIYQQNMSMSSLSAQAPDSYTSEIFSHLPYNDLRKAHTESVIPVTDEDYNKVRKFRTVNEYTNYRDTQDVKPLSEQQALAYLKRKDTLEDVQTTNTAYEMAKQLELAKQKNQTFWSNISQIKQ